MDHVVFFPAHDGSPAFRRVASLEDAVRLVEHLRNSEGVDHVSVHALTEVPLAFKAYYRVEMPGQAPVDVPVEAQVVPAEPVEAVEPAADPQVAEPVAGVVPEQEAAGEAPVPVPSSLGFFAS
jgi:hypothetical protein